ncbi:hypothetical protein TNIN_447101 [Trichonephila inaurata madagascariensis]|uniref:Uncharacterized protein n=1 Tax=Trichonephila inaurata madagascariensis TaxID=2747483 RepID=A0A8X6YPH3_9ARAC|nr:hypothetical protein TNIN_447101 [Trichonephila inaurata madagascariensis]
MGENPKRGKNQTLDAPPDFQSVEIDPEVIFGKKKAPGIDRPPLQKRKTSDGPRIQMTRAICNWDFFLFGKKGSRPPSFRGCGTGEISMRVFRRVRAKTRAEFLIAGFKDFSCGEILAFRDANA